MLRPVISNKRPDREWTSVTGGGQRELIPPQFHAACTATHFAAAGTEPLNPGVHLHRLDFQVLFVLRGSMTMVYESLGPPIKLVAGDFVLQPPQQCHAVIESSADLELLEFFGPRDHEIIAREDMVLPSQHIDRNRLFAGQSNKTSHAGDAVWHEWGCPDWYRRAAGLGPASLGRVDGFEFELKEPGIRKVTTSPSAISFYFVADGIAGVELAAEPAVSNTLDTHDSFLLPANTQFRLEAGTEDTRLILFECSKIS